MELLVGGIVTMVTIESISHKVVLLGACVSSRLDTHVGFSFLREEMVANFYLQLLFLG